MPPVEQLVLTLSKLMCLVSPRESRRGGWLVIRWDVWERNRMERHKTRGRNQNGEIFSIVPEQQIVRVSRFTASVRVHLEMTPLLFLVSS